ncbi:MAG: hypothetical protein ABIP42_13425 [Planctomycetota bacterium]
MRSISRLGLLTFASLALPVSVIRAQSPLHTFHGDSPNDEFGVAVALVGDANRDGYADILVGAHWDDNSGGNSGSARLFSGLDGAVIATFNGDGSNAFFGIAVAGIGDVDGDGYDDFAVGADGSDAGGSESGLVRVFSGKTGSVLRNIAGASAGEQLGSTLAGVYDSAQLLLAGAPSSNLARVVSTADGSTAWTFFGGAAGDLFGAAVASGRDLNGDGVPDYAVGAPNDDVGGVDSGSVAIFSGANGNLLRTLRGLSAGDRFGSSVAVIPDVDGDGRAEIVVGAPRRNGPGSDAGAAYVFSGSSGSLIFSRAGEAAGDQFGTAVADVSTRLGNPEPVFVVGARWNDAGGNNAGAAYVYSALSGAQLRVLRGHAGGDWFGGAVGGGEDVNGDGIGDFVVSARLGDINGSNSGSVEVHASPLLPNTWYVDASVPGPGAGTQANPYRSIQYAITRSTTRSGDSIEISSGDYLENVVIDSKALTLSGSGPTRPVLDGQGIAPVISILGENESKVTVRGLTLRHGEATRPDPNNSYDTFGAGIYAPEICLTVDNCVVTDNHSSICGDVPHGMGIYATGRNITIIGCEITGNSSVGAGCISFLTYGGGGICAGGDSVSILDCIIQNNTIAANGGGVSVAGNSVLIRGCIISDNLADGALEGGGIDIYALGQSSIEVCTISRNSCRDSGAGIAAYGPLLIKDCVIEGNGCGEGSYSGGGVLARNAGTVVERCVVAENTTRDGAGLAGPLTATDCTIVRNVSNSGDQQYAGCGQGGGAHGCTLVRCLLEGNNFGTKYNLGCSGSAAANSTLIQCTIAGNIAEPDLSSGVLGTTLANCVIDSCVVWGNTGASSDGMTVAQYSDLQGGGNGTGNIAQDPLFVVPGHDHHLTGLSPCIDAGNPVIVDPDGSRADMGAFPFDPNYVPAQFAYCTAKTNSCNTLPAIAWTGSPHANATSGFVISASGARSGRPGLLLYSPNGTANSAFQGGTLCIAPQGLRRGLPVTSIGGSGGALCDAQFSIDWAAFASGNLGGTPQTYLNSVGQRINVQWWGRDTQLAGSFLSNAIQYEVAP